MNTYIDLISDIKTNGFKSSPRGQEVTELLFKDLRVTNSETIVDSKFRNTADSTTPEGRYLRAEFMWYMSGYLQPDYIARFGRMWDSLRNPKSERRYPPHEVKIHENKVNSNYGYHVFYKPVTEIPIYKYNLLRSYPDSPFSYVVRTLNRDPHSRQAIIQYTLPNIYKDGVRDFTCTQTQHFLVRGGRLYNLVHIRSSDAVKGLTFDIPWWDIVGQLLARVLGVQYSDMLVHIGSAHYYERDYDLIDNLLDGGVSWKQLLLKDHTELVENVQAVSDGIATFFTSKYPESRQEIVALINSVYKLFNTDYNAEVTTYSHVIPAYLEIARVFVYLATKFNIESDVCELYNNTFFNAMFDVV